MTRRKKDAATKVRRRRVDWSPPPLISRWEVDLSRPEVEDEHKRVSAELFAAGKLGGGN